MTSEVLFADNTGKSADVSSLSAEHVKYVYALHELTPVIQNILNDIFNNLDVPPLLKIGILTPVHKKVKTKS
jgi:hypothetical protein